MTTIGFIGFGEAGSSLAEGLRQEGVANLLAFDVMLTVPSSAPKMIQRIDAAGAKPVDLAEVAARSRVIIAAVPANYAVPVALDVVRHLAAGTIYADVSTASPVDKAKIADLVKSRSGRFVDGAMMGALPKYKHQVPMLISGDGVDAFLDIMQPYHMDLTKVSETPGAATSIKFIRSVVSKGLACLVIESLNAAQKFGVEEVIADSLCEFLGPDFDKMMDRLVSSTVVHAARRSHEMQNAADMLREAGVSSIMAEASKQKLEWLESVGAKSRFADNVPDTWRQIIRDWGV